MLKMYLWAGRREGSLRSIRFDPHEKLLITEVKKALISTFWQSVFLNLGFWIILNHLRSLPIARSSQWTNIFLLAGLYYNWYSDVDLDVVLLWALLI